jgi:hypothetical protein
MWTCPVCQQAFIRQNQTHSCQERTVADFLAGKSAHTVELFHYFVTYYQSLGSFQLHPAKHRIGFAARTRFGYVHQLGKNFIDVVLHFPTPYRDTFCFHKVAGGPLLYNHYFRLYNKLDLTGELESFLRLALQNDTGNPKA